MKHKWPVELLLGLVVAGCNLALGQSSYEPATAQSQPADEFAKLRIERASNLRDKNIDAAMAGYAPDVEFVDPGHDVHGIAELRKLYETMTTTMDSDLVFRSAKVEVTGRTAKDSGKYNETLVLRQSAKRMYISGTYETSYIRGNDGAWLIAKMVWTMDGSGTPQVYPAFDPHPVVALTFDDLPAAGILPAADKRSRIATAIARELKANHLEGTYGFVNASKMENDPDAQQAMHIWLDAGMNVGSHTWSHMSLTQNTAAAFEEDVAKNEPALAEFGQTRDWHWFRYPFLWEGDTLEKRRAVRGYLKEHGYRIAQVTLDFEDYAWNNAYTRCSAKQDGTAIAWLKQSYLEAAREYIMLGREEQQIAFGHEIPNVLLLHETAFTTLMLPDLLELLRGEGFTFAALADVERDPAFALDPDAALRYGGTLPDQFMDSRKLAYPPFTPKPFEKMESLCK